MFLNLYENLNFIFFALKRQQEPRFYLYLEEKSFEGKDNAKLYRAKTKQN